MKTNTLPLSLLLATLMTGCGGSQEDTIVAIENIATDNSSGKPAKPLTPTLFTRPDSITQSSFAVFNFEAQPEYVYECQINQDTITECTPPVTYLGLDTGDQQFTVWAVDQDTNRSEPASYQWTLGSIYGDSNLADTHEELIATDVQPSSVDSNSWRGIFRINCDFAHSSYNDPIVYPGQEDAAHLHRFYGNTLTDHNTTNESLYTMGESSCQGNTLNLSAYWVPALLAPAYDEQTGERLIDETGEAQWQVVPAVVGNDDEAHEIFYYSAGVDDLSSIQPIPAGLRMIAGNPMGMPGMEQDTSIVRWHCQSWESDDASNPQFSSSIPECLAPDRVRMDIFFPSCWNGIDLDSDDHQSHMAYPVNTGGPEGTQCPATHPIPIVRPSYHYAFGVKPEVYEPSTRSSKGWKIASDIYAVDDNNPGGMSLHADWINAWHPEVMQSLLENCIQGELDCHDGNLANGYRLSGTRAGTQVEPEIINGGRGVSGNH